MVEQTKGRLRLAGLLLILLCAVNAFFLFSMTYFYAGINALLVGESMSVKFIDVFSQDGITVLVNETFDLEIEFDSTVIEKIIMAFFVFEILWCFISSCKCFAAKYYDEANEKNALAYYIQKGNKAVNNCSGILAASYIWAIAFYLAKQLVEKQVQATGFGSLVNITMQSDTVLLAVINTVLLVIATLLVREKRN